MTAAEQDSGSTQGRALPRWSLTVVAGIHALVFAWAGTKLPWSDWSTFALICWGLALGHTATAVAAAGRLRWLPTIWRGASLASLLVLVWISWELIAAASYLAGLYGALGEGLGAAMLAVIGLFALPTVPLAAWGLAATWKPSHARAAVTATGVVVVAISFGAWREARAAGAEPMPLPSRDADTSAAFYVRDELARVRGERLPAWELPPIPREGTRIIKVAGGHKREPLRVPSLLTTEPVACVPDPSAGVSTAVLTFLAAVEPTPAKPRKRNEVPLAPVAAVSRCVTSTPERLPAAILEAIAREAQRGPVKIDIISAVTPLRSRHPALDPFALRPGLDGVCDEQHCLMPWQLVATEAFIANEPLTWVPDLRFGISPIRLRVALGFDVPEEVVAWDREQRDAARLARLTEAGKARAKPADADGWLLLDGLTRIETLSFVFNDGGKLIPLVRGRERELALTRERYDHALTLAENHIAKASQRDGRFRYLLDPYTGEQQSTSWNLPRQAGTTLVACELGRDEARTRKVADRSLAFMAKRGRPVGDAIALTKSRKATEADLGSTALPAIAFFRCRERVGSTHDETLRGITEFLLAIQREDGGFYPALDLATGVPVDGPEPMYAGGQAIFALVLAEALVLDQPELAASIGLPDAARLRDAIDRAMSYYAGPYWDNFARDFFYLEENWHCLAARAALEHHRHPAYEQFCVDYMTYKSRVVLGPDSDVAPEFWGGYSMGNILVPVNTPAAGFAEGLAAAMSIKHARGDDLSEDRARMRSVVEFLVRQQWTEDTCFACAPNRTVVGGFSESMGVAEIRIDYTQHAWAGLGHGGAWIVDELASEG